MNVFYETRFQEIKERLIGLWLKKYEPLKKLPVMA